MLAGWRERVAALKREVAAIAYAARDSRTPWAARLLVLAIVAYAVSPIDLIPDFIPVLGLLDDLLLLPAAILLAIRMIPSEVLAEARQRADARPPPSKGAAVVIALIWIALMAALVWWLASKFN
jgi:uncharacterized membrane protein YkvA (DUF1232 family)